MALIFMDGFDKYGPANSNGTGVAALLTAGEWTSTSVSTFSIAAGLSATGYALGVGNSGAVSKTLAANYSRLIGGVRFSSTLAGAIAVQFYDAATAQATISVNATGTVTVRNGGVAGTALATSTASVTANSTHYLEWDVTFANAGSFTVWLDGVAIIGGSSGITGSGDTTGSANNYANVVWLSNSSTAVGVFDDLYLFDATGTANNAVLLTSPRIETTFPTSDSAVQFGFGAGILGSSIARTATATGTSSNSLNLRRFVPNVACTINSIGGIPGSSGAGINFRGVIYTDSSGAAGTLMSSGATVTGATTNVPITLPLTTPQNLTAGTAYWLGFMTDTTLSWQNLDGSFSGYRAAATFASGAPGTAPAMTSGLATWLLWGNLTGITGNNWYEAAQQPPPGLPSYVFDATVNHEDLYNFAALSAIPAAVYAVAVKAYVGKSDTGSRTVSMRTKSGATDSAGSLAGQAPGTTFGWLTSNFELNPNGSVAWTGAALNAATSGLRVDS